MLIIGIDPGKNGAVAFSHYVGKETIEANRHTPLDIAGFIENRVKHYGPKVMCYIERVQAMPKDGRSSAFKFGTNFGTYLGILTALKVPFTYVAPGTWQRVMGCLSKGDKNVTKRKAQELFPGHKITHANADALLIAEYGYRKSIGSVTPDKGRYKDEADDL